MKVIPPLDVTDAMLTSIDIPENDYPEWADATAYVRGDYVISTTTHTVYHCLVDHTSDPSKNPDTETAALADPLIDDPDPVHWQVIGATNRWKLFDKKPSVQATQNGGFEVTLTPGVIISGLGCFNVTGASEVTVTMTNDGTEVYSATVQMTDETVVIDGWTYYFADIQVLPEFVLTDLPPYSEATLTVTFTGAGEVGCGQIAFGPVWQFGYVEVGQTGFEGLDFSAVGVDDFGNITTIERAETDIHTYSVVLRDKQLLGFRSRMRELRGGRRAVWIGSDDRRLASINYGFRRRYSPIYSEGGEAIISIEVQGVT